MVQSCIFVCCLWPGSILLFCHFTFLRSPPAVSCHPQSFSTVFMGASVNQLCTVSPFWPPQLTATGLRGLFHSQFGFQLFSDWAEYSCPWWLPLCYELRSRQTSVSCRTTSSTARVAKARKKNNYTAKITKVDSIVTAVGGNCGDVLLPIIFEVPSNFGHIL